MQLNGLQPADRASVDRAASRRRATRRYYETHAEQYARATATFDTTDAMRRFSGHLVPGSRILDVGCGSGRDLIGFQAAGYEASGLDLSPALVAIARAQSGRPVIEGDLRSAPFDDSSFDGIWAMASLLHLERDETVPALEEMGRLLVPGGILFASVKRGAGRVCDDYGRWFTLHDEAGWTAILEASGFDVIEVVGEPPAGATGSVSPGWISSLSRAR